MIDTGASFSMVTQNFAQTHNLTIYPGQGTFAQADCGATSGQLIGFVNMTIQVNDYLCLHLEEVKVVPSGQYNMLLGCDVLHGNGTSLGRARVDMMGTITWVLLNEGGSHHFSTLQPTPGGPRPPS